MLMNDLSIIRNVVARTQDMGREASRAFEERYARLLLSMSLQEAKSILGFPPGAVPTPEEISKAYRRKALENHPDRGGSHDKMVEINVAKDILEGKGRATWTPEPAPRRERPKPAPVEYEATLKGASFADAWGNAGVPASVEWKFISIPEWYWGSSNSPGHRVWCLYGQNDQKHVFLAFKERGESAGGVWLDEQGKQAPPGTGKFTKIEQDWQSSLIEIPIAQNIAKIAPKYLKEIGTAWADGAKPKPPKKFVAWPGGKPTEQIISKIPRSGGAALKDILVGTGLLADEDPAVAGRKSVVEIYTKYSKERYERAKKLKAEGKKKMVTNADQYDFFVRVNGKTEKLEDDTITKMERSFIPWVLNWEISEGAPKNLTRMRGGRLKYGPAEAIRELANCLTGEPSWLHIAMEKAVEEYEEPAKTAMLQLRDDYTLFECAKIAGMSPLAFFSALHGKEAREFATPEALKEYLQEHPKADKSKHTVNKEHGEDDEHGDHEEPKKSWKERLKGLSEKATNLVKNAPKAVKQFIEDESFRKKTLMDAHKALTEAPEKIAKNAINTVKHEVKEFKDAGKGVAALMKGEKMTSHQKKALKTVATHMAISVAAAALTASGPLAVAGAVGKGLVKHTAMKAVGNMLGHVHVLEELGHIGHGIKHIMEKLAAEKGDADPEDVLANFVMAAVAKEMEGLSDEDIKKALEDADEEDEGSKKEASVDPLREFQNALIARNIAARFVGA